MISDSETTCAGFFTEKYRRARGRICETERRGGIPELEDLDTVTRHWQAYGAPPYAAALAGYAALFYDMDRFLLVPGEASSPGENRAFNHGPQAASDLSLTSGETSRTEPHRTPASAGKEETQVTNTNDEVVDEVVGLTLTEYRKAAIRVFAALSRAETPRYFDLKAISVCWAQFGIGDEAAASPEYAVLRQQIGLILPGAMRIHFQLPGLCA